MSSQSLSLLKLKKHFKFEHNKCFHSFTPVLALSFQNKFEMVTKALDFKKTLLQIFNVRVYQTNHWFKGLLLAQQRNRDNGVEINVCLGIMA